MKKIYIVVLFYLPLFILGQNNISVKLIDSITIKTEKFIGKDVYDNYYSISQNTFLKENKSQKLNYQNLTLGNLYTVDYSNPLLLVLFYKDFNSVVLLDQQLNEVQKISGNDVGLIFDIIGLARQNSLWFYDAVNQKFGIYNFKENTFQLISTYFPTKIKYWKSSYNSLNFINENNEAFTLNYFGKIQNLGNVKQSESALIIEENKIILKQEGKLYFQTPENITEIKISQKSFENFCFNDGILSIFTNEKVYNYKINLP
ncbi:hypothetical protein [Flavobacterium okayamense]|uniref:WG containing repeat-containing protein n=1 Tax=Flavobacterium okayamense TaxID=2830782 RepID=A0ABM7S2W9_9FLAO|nr:hypothetical protein [Flavobacterium okayamense]BCY27476.1 hypothetical protein KK2020170_03440 [Flavobacterium okayamense]